MITSKKKRLFSVLVLASALVLVAGEIRSKCSPTRRFLRNMCKNGEHPNYEGVGSSMSFWRTGRFYADLFNLTLVPSRMVAAHGVGDVQDFFGFFAGVPCNASQVASMVESGRLKEITVSEPVDWVTGDGGVEASLAAQGKPKDGTLASIVSKHQGTGVVFTLYGCPKLTQRNTVTEATEQWLRSQYENAYLSSAMRQGLFNRVSHTIRIAVHFRGGDVIGDDAGGTALSSLNLCGQQALLQHSGKECRYGFQSGAGLRLVPLSYYITLLQQTLAALEEVRAAYGDKSRFDLQEEIHFYAEGTVSLFKAFVNAFPQVIMHVSNTRHQGSLAEHFPSKHWHRHWHTWTSWLMLTFSWWVEERIHNLQLA